jgi:hypothetical protein
MPRRNRSKFIEKNPELYKPKEGQSEKDLVDPIIVKNKVFFVMKQKAQRELNKKVSYIDNLGIRHRQLGIGLEEIV